MKLPQLVYDRKAIKVVLVLLLLLGIGLIAYVALYAHAWVSKFGRAAEALSE